MWVGHSVPQSLADKSTCSYLYSVQLHCPYLPSLFRANQSLREVIVVGLVTILSLSGLELFHLVFRFFYLEIVFLKYFHLSPSWSHDFNLFSGRLFTISLYIGRSLFISHWAQMHRRAFCFLRFCRAILVQTAIFQG